MNCLNYRCLMVTLALGAALISGSRAADVPVGEWKVGAPIVNYWAGPGYPGGSALDDAAAKQLKEGGWNVVWCNEKELDVAQKHGLRGLLTDPLLSSAAHNNDLDDPQKRALLDAFINRVKKHPALYAYHLRDEPSAAAFGHIGKVVAYLRERDPSHVPYINLFPIYASNEQLGTKGEPVAAYRQHLEQYVETVRPKLLSYDHYQSHECRRRTELLSQSGDDARAVSGGWRPVDEHRAGPVAGCRIPPRFRGHREFPMATRCAIWFTRRWLTVLKGISYYVYSYPKHEGGIALADGTPTPLYHALKPLNREFIAIATELQPLKSLGVYHAGDVAARCGRGSSSGARHARSARGDDRLPIGCPSSRRAARTLRLGLIRASARRICWS